MQIAEYNTKKEEARQVDFNKEKARLEEMQFVLAEQHRKDWERIQFRKEEYDRKQQELRERHQNEEYEELQREERLQALADRVRPHVEIDHARVMQPTKVTRNPVPHTDRLLSRRRTTLIAVCSPASTVT